MSVLIKGMEMPKKCNDCPLINCVHDNQGYYPRPENCPLVELPPHGRLIDADTVKNVFAEKYVIYDDTFDLIDSAPTIIEAEEDE